MPLNKCLNCGEPFEAVRATAKFHNDICRTEYNRKKKKGIDLSAITPPIEIEDGEQKGMDLLLEQPPQVPQRVRLSKSELIERMNARLEAKGMPLIQEKIPPVEFVRTGIQEIDELNARYDSAGWGGLPRKHITEIFGTAGAGKTSLMKKIINFNEDLAVLYVDVENGMTNAPENILMTKNVILEEIEEMVCQALDTDEFDLIVIDSVAFMVSQKEKENEKEAMMAHAKAMGRFVRRCNAYLRQHGDNGKLKDSPGTAVVFINQLRDTGASFGVKEFTPGGRALSFGASLRIEFRSAKADKIIRKGEVVGQRVRATIKKSRFNGEDADTTLVFPLIFAELG